MKALAASAWSNALLRPRIAPGAYERRPDAGDGQDNPFNLSTKKTAQFALYAIVGHEQAQMDGSKNLWFWAYLCDSISPALIGDDGR
ncbi:hypothetical protein KBX73_14645 [Acetobacter persici]|uniref:hypothetical protein n=1 Tax=Acetobacter persici TaxID=1076596 RepID=UPI0020CCC632|nr:hypothetical protein [Acetobacter persici]MCP9320989.1 hypothetical protein [Acetobacter persici]